MAAWAGAIATFLAASVALLVAAGVFDSLRGPRLRLTFQRAEPWCRTAAQGELWVRAAVENAGRAPAHGCVGRLVGLATDGRARTDLDPVQLRWAGVPRSRAFDAIDIRPGQREFLAPMRSLVAMVAGGGEITILHTLDVSVDHPGQGISPPGKGHHDDTAQRRAGRQRKLEVRK